MNLFELPAEIRLKIYSYLLLLPVPVLIVQDFANREPDKPLAPPHIWAGQRHRAHFGILRVSKTAYAECAPFLYAKNKFEFADTYYGLPGATNIACLSQFLDRIGPHAAEIQHICMSLPDGRYDFTKKNGLYQEHRTNFALIKSTCFALRILEMSHHKLSRQGILDDSPYANELLDSINVCITEITSLKQVILNISVYMWHTIKESVLDRLRNYGWVIHVVDTGVPFD